MTSLELTLLYLLAAVLGVVLCRFLRLPPMLGYLFVGVLIGPNALALAQDSDSVRHLGEFGVVFLMFVIGLEFNLSKLRSMRMHVFGLGLSQVVLTEAYPYTSIEIRVRKGAQLLAPITILGRAQSLPRPEMSAFHHRLRTGRGGPVVVEIPKDVYNEPVPDDFDYKPVISTRWAPDPAAVREMTGDGMQVTLDPGAEGVDPGGVRDRAHPLLR